VINFFCLKFGELAQLYSAVMYITQASPTSMTWLNVDDAKKNDIDVTLLEPATTTSSDLSPQIESSSSPASLRATAGDFVTRRLLCGPVLMTRSLPFFRDYTMLVLVFTVVKYLTTR
jgi:hypothetical protein